MSKIRVAICDDAMYVCKGYGMQVDACTDMECVGMAYNSADCLKMVKEQCPDILLLDIQMEEEKSGINLIPEIKNCCKDTVIIMLTSYSDDEYIFLSLLNGAAGYVIKSTDGDETIAKIREEYQKQKGGNGQDIIMEAFKREAKQVYTNYKSAFYLLDSLVKLSPKEYSTLRDIYKGFSYREIAQKYITEEATVRTCVSKILKKLECKSMRELINQLKELRVFENDFSG